MRQQTTVTRSEFRVPSFGFRVPGSGFQVRPSRGAIPIAGVGYRCPGGRADWLSGHTLVRADEVSTTDAVAGGS